MNRRWIVPALLVALAIAGILLFYGPLGGPRTGVTSLRGRDGEAVRSVVVLDAKDSARNIIRVFEPEDGARVAHADLMDLTFRWSSVPDAGQYMFVANNEVGEIVWRAAVSDTTLMLPEKATRALFPGERLKWLVQVPELSSSTDIHRIETH